MGISTITDIVPFIAHNVFNAVDIYDRGPFDIMVKICEPDDFVDSTISLTVHGWTLGYDNEGVYRIGKRNRLYAHRWTKDGMTVYTINESHDDAVGSCELAVIADNENAINEFCNDINIPPRFGIDENDTAQQTM